MTFQATAALARRTGPHWGHAGRTAHPGQVQSQILGSKAQAAAFCAFLKRTSAQNIGAQHRNPTVQATGSTKGLLESLNRWNP